MFKKIDKNLFSAILYIIVGALLIIFKSEMLNWAMTIAGIFFIITGILDVLKKNYVNGGVSLVIGIAIMVLGWLATKIVLLVLGILIAVKGVVALLDALKKKKMDIIEVVFAALTVVTGILLAFGGLVNVLFIIAGILLILDGVVGIIPMIKK